jgi:hypothetical protein
VIRSKVIRSKNPRSKFFGCTGVSHPCRRGVRLVHIVHVLSVLSVLSVATMMKMKIF